MNPFLLKQNTARHPLRFLLVSSADGSTPVYGATPTVGLNKDGAGWTVPAGAVVEESLTTPTFPGTVFTAAANTGGHLAASTTYYYKVVAINAVGQTLASAEQSYAVPAGTATNQITLNWNAVAGATGYEIFRSTAAGSEQLLATVGAVTGYADTSATVPSGAVPTQNTTSAGWYHVVANATDTNTLGCLSLHATATGAVPTDVTFQVVAVDSDDPAWGMNPSNLTVGVSTVLAGSSVNQTALPLSGDLTAGRADYFSQTFTATGLDSTGWNQLYFAIKADPAEDDDSNYLALVRVTNGGAAGDGLLIFNGQPASGGLVADASITVATISPNTSFTVTLQAAAMALPPSPSGSPYTWEVIRFTGSKKERIGTGGFTLEQTVMRGVTAV